MTTLFTESWTGADGSAWPGVWTTSLVGAAGGVVDIQSNQGHLRTGGSISPTYNDWARAILASGSFLSVGAEVYLTYTTTDDGSFDDDYLSLHLRASGNGSGASSRNPTNSYEAIIGGGALQLFTNKSGASTMVATVALATNNSGTTYGFRFRVEGTSSTVLSAKVWDTSGAEPGAWSLTFTDSSSPVTAAGQFQLSLQNGFAGVVENFYLDNLTLDDLASDSTIVGVARATGSPDGKPPMRQIPPGDLSPGSPVNWRNPLRGGADPPALTEVPQTGEALAGRLPVQPVPPGLRSPMAFGRYRTPFTPGALPAPSWSADGTVAGNGAVTGSGVRTALRTATATGTGTLDATGVRTALRTASTSGLGTISGAGFKSVTRTATAVGTGTLNASGYKTVARTASTSGAAVLIGAGTRTTFRSATTTGNGTIAASGFKTRFRAGSVTGNGTTTATGTRTALRSAAATGAGVLAASGFKSATRSASATGNGTLNATGYTTRFRTASVSGTAALAASGARGGTATGSLAGNGTVSATGKRTALRSGTASGTAAITAAGSRTALRTAAVSGTGTLDASGIGHAPDALTATGHANGNGTLSATGRLDAVTAGAAGPGTRWHHGPAKPLLPRAQQNLTVYVDATGTGVSSCTATLVGRTVTPPPPAPSNEELASLLIALSRREVSLV